VFSNGFPRRSSLWSFNATLNALQTNALPFLAPSYPPALDH
jgi:hypothetical protein